MLHKIKYYLNKTLRPLLRILIWVVAVLVISQWLWAGWQFNVGRVSDYLMGFLAL